MQNRTPAADSGLGHPSWCHDHASYVTSCVSRIETAADVAAWLYTPEPGQPPVVIVDCPVGQALTPRDAEAVAEALTRLAALAGPVLAGASSGAPA